VPHLTLEYTSNLPAATASQELFAHLHQILAEVGGIRLGNCKSRAVALSNYYVGAGDPEEAFVHLDVRFLAGRPAEVKRAVGEALLAALRQAYASGELPVQITVEISDIPKENYFKFPDGTLG
jgi:5-carboxymethyl-2-hydroxymuconate isomerase